MADAQPVQRRFAYIVLETAFFLFLIALLGLAYYGAYQMVEQVDWVPRASVWALAVPLGALLWAIAYVVMSVVVVRIGERGLS